MHEIGYPSDRYSIISPLLPNSEDEQEPKVVAADLEPFLRQHGPVVVTLGAWIRLYDFDTVVEAFLRLRRFSPAAGLIVVSSSFDQDDDYERTVRARAAGNGDHISFRQDIDHQHLVGLMARADVVVRGAKQESFGLSRVEALMAGTPVVGTRTGEQRFVEPYDYGDASSLLDAIGLALRNTTRTDEAREVFRAEAESNLQAIIRIYDSIS